MLRCPTRERTRHASTLHSTNLCSLIALLVPEYSAHLSPSAPPHSQYLSPYLPTSSLPVVRSVTHTAKYAAALQSLASEWHIPCLDLWSLTPERKWRRLFYDELHLTAAG